MHYHFDITSPSLMRFLRYAFIVALLFFLGSIQSCKKEENDNKRSGSGGGGSSSTYTIDVRGSILEKDDSFIPEATVEFDGQTAITDMCACFA